MRIIKIITCSVLPAVMTFHAFAQQDTAVSNDARMQLVQDSSVVGEDTSRRIPQFYFAGERR